MFSFTNIPSYHDALRSGRVTCRDAVEHYLEIIQEKSGLNAFVETYADEAILLASRLDQQRSDGKPMGKLHGVVIAIKDVICYAGHRTTAASAMLKDMQPIYTATALQYLLDEEAIIIGTCNCDEFAMGSKNIHSVYGPVKNEKDTLRSPGGSSGGSAVAVQAGMCMVSLGSDTGGSVRQPADHCGIIGFKPGYGRISRYGLIAYASSFDQIGIFATSISDVRLMLEIMAKPDMHDATMDPEGCNPASTSAQKRFCVFRQVMDHPSLDTEIRQAIEQKAEMLKQDGHTVELIDFNLLDYIVPAYYVLTTAEASSNLSRYDGIRYGHRSALDPGNLDDFYRNNRSEGFGKEVKRRIMLGTFVLSTGYYDAYYAKAQKVRNRLINKVNEIFSTFDAILLPTVPATAPLINEADQDPLADYLADIFTVFANLTGIPAISLPLFSHRNNMPFGLQVMTKRSDELSLLSVAEQISTASAASSNQ